MTVLLCGSSQTHLGTLMPSGGGHIINTYVMERLDTWLGAQKTREVFGDHALAVLDHDHFKRVNDIHGHAIGDKLLISLSRDVVSHIRTMDMFGRIGGEEFLLFMPNCPLTSAKARLETLQEVIGQLDAKGARKPLSYTFSAGVVTLRPGKDLHDEIRRADKLFCRAKAEGRARVVGRAQSPAFWATMSFHADTG